MSIEWVLGMAAKLIIPDDVVALEQVIHCDLMAFWIGYYL